MPLKTAWVQGTANYLTGEIQITRGMLNMIFNEAELACLIGHEIGHHMLGHAEERFSESRFHDYQKIFSKVLDEAGGRSEWHAWLEHQLNEVAVSGWSESREEEADRFGAMLAAKAGYDPYAFVDLFERLARQVEMDLGYRLKQLKGTHKALDVRARNLEAFLQKKGYERGQGKRNYVEYMESLAVLHTIRSHEADQGRPGDDAFMEEHINQNAPQWMSPLSLQLIDKLAEQDLMWDLYLLY